MTPADAEMLSALLDGELDAARAREVEMQIAADPALRRAFEALSAADAAWRAAAATAIFVPAITLPASENRLGWFAASAPLIAVLVLLRMAPKLIGPPVVGFGLHAIALAVLLAALIRLSRTGGIGSPMGTAAG